MFSSAQPLPALPGSSRFPLVSEYCIRTTAWNEQGDVQT